MVTPVIDTKLCDAASGFDRLPEMSICSLFSALNSIPQTSAHDEAALRSLDKLTLVELMFLPAVYAVVSSANIEQSL